MAEGSDLTLDARRERAAMNQSLFREVNERLVELASPTTAISFVCECETVGCVERITLSAAEYEAIRSESNSFFVAPGHNVPDVEVVRKRTDWYVVVSKLGAGAPVAERLDPRTPNGRPG